MQNTVEQDLENLRTIIKQIELQESATVKAQKISKAYDMHRNVKKRLQEEYPLGYKRDRFLKQLQATDKKIQTLQKEFLEEQAFKSRISADLGLDMNSVQYNPRMTIQQNVLRSVLCEQLKQESKVDVQVDKEQLEKMAQKMEQVKQVYQQIGQLVEEQGLGLSIIQANNLKALNQVKQANQELREAQALQTGRKIEEQSPEDNPKAPAPKNQRNKTQAKQKVKVIRGTMRGFLGGIGESIKNFFRRLFGRKKKPSASVSNERGVVVQQPPRLAQSEVKAPQSRKKSA